MSMVFRNEIDLTVSIAGGVVAAVDIMPRNRPPLTRLFAGKPVTSLLGVVPRLFSLCSVAHQVAFVSAVEAARGEDVGAATRRQRIASVVAERLAELLRGLFVGRFALDSGSIAAVRSMMQAASVLGAGIAQGGYEPPRREVVSRITAALAALGIADERAMPGSPLALHIAALDNEVLSTVPAQASFLSVADDRAVVARLLAEGTAFSDAPDLDGFIPETGVWARSAMREQIAPKHAGAAERLKARVREVAELCRWLVGHEQGEDEAAVVASYSLGSGCGGAAVECARGRLHHAVELDGDDRIARLEFLAPTEWNFHARGPLVRCLQGAVLAGRRSGQEAVRSMVAAFDPCVSFQLNFRELAHA